jgi:glycosyltransferase involved in cell wall biosynthesis
MSFNKPNLAIVVPCYNEEKVLHETATQLRSVIDKLSMAGKIDAHSYICFVDDGSEDRTWQIISDLNRQYSTIGGLRLSRNRGHQIALMAGLFETNTDLVISIDADLQDDVQAIAIMVDAALDGADIVYGVRKGRDADTLWKRLTARSYYRLLSALGVEIVYDHADYRLLTRKALDALRQYGERNVFLRALIPQLGFSTRTVYYDRANRLAGESKYPLRKMLALALEGVTSFSTKPLRMVTLLGILLSFFSISLGLWATVAALSGYTVPGWASTVIPIYVVCGVQLFSLGVIGEYIGKIYLETKGRPRFFISEKIAPAKLSC